MPPRLVRALGLAGSALYAGLIVWLYATAPRTFAEVRGGVASLVDAYEVNQAAFEDGRQLFRDNNFEAARTAFAAADPARRDAVTQFYIAYSFYRQGWGRLYNDDDLFRQGLEALDRAQAVAPDGRVRVADPDLGAPSSDELRAELEAGMRRDASDLNPLRVFRRRK